ncbi:uncharacterized protein LOC124459825 [Drosophila willistoni]|uniref:uncharacterized protein LOC124459825 n=1 Tax=Drosophila willistoni TaxID=7260 RepID=UPI001F07804F|nr:uncharacterized protein LOC124459825 [Drosophila willistoni]
MITVCLFLDQITDTLTDDEVDAIPGNASSSDIAPNKRCYARDLLKPYLGDNGKIDLKRLVNNFQNPDSIKMLQCKEKYDNVIDAADCDYSVYILQCLISE